MAKHDHGAKHHMDKMMPGSHAGRKEAKHAAKNAEFSKAARAEGGMIPGKAQFGGQDHDPAGHLQLGGS